MRRTTFIAVIVAALGLGVPGAALARSHRSAHARHHAGSKHHKTLHARTLRLTPASVNRSTSSTASGQPDSIGTVGSFTNNMLTLNLNDGSTVTGLVDPNSTEFECVSAPSSSTAQTAATREDGGSGSDGGSSSGSGSGDSSGSGDGSSGSTTSGDSSGSGSQPATQPTPTQSGEDGQEAQENEQADSDATEDQNENQNGVEDNQGEDQSTAACNSSLLTATPPTAIKEAELRITSSGAVFKKIELFH